jgi:hypothetical protein
VSLISVSLEIGKPCAYQGGGDPFKGAHGRKNGHFVTKMTGDSGQLKQLHPAIVGPAFPGFTTATRAAG